MKLHLALSDEKPDVSRLWAPTFGLRIGSVVVKMGGVAGVGTDEAYQRRGYSRLVMEESTRYFTETGHDLAVLFGIPDFYHRFGYTPTLPVTTVTIKVQDALPVIPHRAREAYTVRPLEESDWDAVLALYADNNRTRTGTLVRPRETWTGYQHGTAWSVKKTDTYVAIDDGNVVSGFVTLDAVEDACRVGDLGGRTAAVFTPLLATIAEQAQCRNVETFEIKLPPDHPFTLFCRRCGAVVSTVYEHNRNGMARIIGLRSLAEKLAPLFTERLRGALPEATPGALELRTDIGSVTLEVTDGAVRVADAVSPTWIAALPQMRLTQLVFGFRGVEDIAQEDDVDIPADAVPLLHNLFPIGNPWMAMPDWF